MTNAHETNPKLTLDKLAQRLQTGKTGTTAEWPGTEPILAGQSSVALRKVAMTVDVPCICEGL